MRCRPGLLRVLVGLPVLGLAGFFFAGMWQMWLGPQVRDYLDRHEAKASEADRRRSYERAGGGLVYDLATEAVRPGNPVAALTDRYPTAVVHPYHRFRRLLYRDGDAWVELWAKDGQLVQAIRFYDPEGRRIDRRLWFCDEFFTMSPADHAARTAELKAFAADRRDAMMAAAGIAATFEPYQWPVVGQPSP